MNYQFQGWLYTLLVLNGSSIQPEMLKWIGNKIKINKRQKNHDKYIKYNICNITRYFQTIPD